MAKRAARICVLCEKSTTAKTAVLVVEYGRADQATLVWRIYHMSCYEPLTLKEKHDRKNNGQDCSVWCKQYAHAW